jgi:hypothetical protein
MRAGRESTEARVCRVSGRPIVDHVWPVRTPKTKTPLSFRELEMTALRASAPGAKLPNYLQIVAGIA